MKKMRFVFVMDPVSAVRVHSDTSLVFMLEAQSRGHRVYHCLISDLGLENGHAVAHVRSARMDRATLPPILLGEEECVDLEKVDAVFVRKDPPFDADYLWATQVLEALRGKTLVLNDPRGLREANEKLYAAHFPELMAPTIVSSKKARITAFVDEVGGRAVMKPLDGRGGEGILVLDRSDVNFNSIIESITRFETRMAMVQKYLPEVKEKGDKRVLLLGGEPFGTLLRIPAQNEIRSNLHIGGTANPTDVTAEDRRIIDTIAPRLKRDGLHFVGLDIIGGYLTEVNVTSPTGVQAMDKLYGSNLSAKMIDWVENAANS